MKNFFQKRKQILTLGLFFSLFLIVTLTTFFVTTEKDFDERGEASWEAQYLDSCVFQNQTVYHGYSVTAYKTTLVPFGQSCVSQQRICNNGVLTGTYQHKNCQTTIAQNKTSCQLDGVTLKHGEKREFYSTFALPAGESCKDVAYERECVHGVLTGFNTYSRATCKEIGYPDLYYNMFASPNPCLVSSNGFCSTNIDWEAPDNWKSDNGIPRIQIWVDENFSGNSKLVTCQGSKEGSLDFDKIRKGRVFTFSMYPATGCEENDRITGDPIAEVSITGISKSPEMPKMKSLGMNMWDLWKQYNGYASGGDGSDSYRFVTTAMAEKSLADLSATGTSYIRVSVGGYHVEDLELWVSDPEEYWERMDKMIEETAKNDIQIVPVFAWNSWQFPRLISSMKFRYHDYGNETRANFIRDRQSESFQLLLEYIDDFIPRYKDNPTILFYEIGNEYSHRADIDDCKRRQKVWWPDEGDYCAYLGNFTATELSGFYSSVASYIRTRDNSRPVASGDSIIRPSAEHIRVYPDWFPEGADWGEGSLDSKEQYAKWMNDVYQAFDIVSIHLYKSNFDRFGSLRETLTTAIKTIEDAGKTLWVGEFDGGKRPEASKTFMNEIVDLKIPYAAPWAWQFYHRSLEEHPSTRHDEHSIEPGYTDDLIDYIKETNKKLGTHLSPSIHDNPRIVITWPLNGQNIEDVKSIYAVASCSNAGSVKKVEFLINDEVKKTVNKPPYKFELSKTNLSSGTHKITARTFDDQGRSSEEIISVINSIVKRMNTSPSPKTHLVTYNGNGGTCVPTKRTVESGKTSSAPSCTRSGYTLKNFTRTDGSGGNLNFNTGAVTNVTGNQIIRANWDIDKKCPYTPCPPYEVCFDGVCYKGDINNDGKININDFIKFKKDFFDYKKNGWDKKFARSDLNNNNTLSIKDYSIFVKSYHIVNKITD